jgi:predicted Zn-dependent protease
LQARAGRLDEARQSLQAALRADPSHRAARGNLGQVYLMLAVQAWELAASASPADAALSRRLTAARALLSPPAR